MAVKKLEHKDASEFLNLKKIVDSIPEKDRVDNFYGRVRWFFRGQRDQANYDMLSKLEKVVDKKYQSFQEFMKTAKAEAKRNEPKKKIA